MGTPTDSLSRNILISFVIWCFFSLPIHYLTCRVIRHPIPILQDSIHQTALLPVTIHLHCLSVDTHICRQYLQYWLEGDSALQRLSAIYNYSDTHQWQLSMHGSTHLIDNTKRNQCRNSVATIDYLDCFDIESIISDKESNRGVYNLFFIDSPTNTDGDNIWYLHPNRVAYIHHDLSTFTPNIKKDRNDALFELLQSSIFADLKASKVDINIHKPTLSFTLLHGEPSLGYNFRWNMSQIYSVYLHPIISQLNNLLFFDPIIDSQILFYGHIISPPLSDRYQKKKKITTQHKSDYSADLHKYISFNKKGGYYYVTDKQLQTFVGSTDWNRVSTVSTQQSSIEFVVYIPPRQFIPLHLAKTIDVSKPKRMRNDGFIIPDFGGCAIYNPQLSTIAGDNSSNGGVVDIDSDDLLSAFQILITQLRSMIGLSNRLPKGIHRLTDRNGGISQWEMDLLIRANIITDMRSVRASFSHIYRMIDTVSQLPIHSHVATAIQHSVEALHNAVQHCSEGRVEQCLQSSRKANVLAHTAEFDPSMLPALYFSPEFTYAVYSPYFLPGYIPIIAALAKRLKQWWTQRRSHSHSD